MPRAGALTVAVAAQRPVEVYRDVVEDRAYPTVREWRDRTGRGAVGCFPVYAPVELAHATGMLPVGLFGGGNRVDIAHADSRFQSFICSIVKSTLELGFIGALDVFDALMFQSICDPARNLASVQSRNFPRRPVVYVHLPQNMSSPAAIDYLASEHRRVGAELASVAGRSPNDGDLRSSIAAYDAVRAALRELYALRALAPEKLGTGDLYALARLATLMDPLEVAPVLRRALAAAAARDERPKDRIRVDSGYLLCERRIIEDEGRVAMCKLLLIDPDGMPVEFVCRPEK